jgi:hypothetical protein
MQHPAPNEASVKWLVATTATGEQRNRTAHWRIGTNNKYRIIGNA